MTPLYRVVFYDDRTENVHHLARLTDMKIIKEG
jgi:hypothetical protein